MQVRIYSCNLVGLLNIDQDRYGDKLDRLSIILKIFLSIYTFNVDYKRHYKLSMIMIALKYTFFFN